MSAAESRERIEGEAERRECDRVKEHIVLCGWRLSVAESRRRDRKAERGVSDRVKGR